MNMHFSFLFIFVVMPTLAVIIFLISLAQDRKREEKLFRTGIIYLKNFRSLLTHIQQHRGLTNSYICGYKNYEFDIKQLEELVRNEIKNIESIDEWIKNNSKWQSIIDHWSRLNLNYKNSGAEYNLKQHNILIASILYLIDDLAYSHQLGKLGLVDATDTDWRYLLSIAEYIGQARALGMGAVSRGECSSIMRTQLNHLCLKIEANINRSWPEKTLRDFRALLTTIEEKVITEKPGITPTDYFKLATGCIEDVLLEFDRQVENIQFHRK